MYSQVKQHRKKQSANAEEIQFIKIWGHLLNKSYKKKAGERGDSFSVKRDFRDTAIDRSV